MKKKKMLLVLISIVATVLFVPFIYERIYAGILNRSYSELSSPVKSKNVAIDEIPFSGRLDFEHTDSSANYVSSIYLDTLALTFKVVVKNYTGHADNEETSFITFNRLGEIISTEKYTPVETNNNYHINQQSYTGNGTLIATYIDVKIKPEEHLMHTVLLPGLLKPFPSWKEKSSPVFVRHFVKKKVNLSQLNPFRIGGINGNKKVSIWEGTAYCDVKFENDILKLKLPFGYDALLFNYADYYSELQYYKMPAGFEKRFSVKFIQLNNKLYIVRHTKNS